MTLIKHLNFSHKQIMTGWLLLLCGCHAWAQPVFDANFAPDTIGPGSTSTLIFTINNPDPINPVTDLAFVNNLPAGVFIATPSQAITECVDGLVAAPDGGSTITFTAGRLSAATDCTVSVNVTAAAVATYMNVSGDLTSNAGNSGPASDNLTVDGNRPGFSKSFAPGTVNFGDRSTLTFTIDNSLNSNFAFNAAFIDKLPLGMPIADPSGFSTDCPQPIVVSATPGSQQLDFRSEGLLNSGTQCTVSVDVLGNARGTLNNTTQELTNTSGGLTVSSGKAGDVLTVNSTGDIQLTQTFLDDPVVPGELVALQFNLTNLNRNFVLTDISFTNDLDVTLSGLVAIGLPTNDVCGFGSQLTGTSFLTLSSAILAPEESCSFTVMLQVPAGATSGLYLNTTSEPTGQVSGQATNGNVSSDLLFVNYAPQLSKAFAPSTTERGQTVSMDFTLTNPSPTDSATDINFTDNISRFLSGAQVNNLPANGFCGAGSTAFIFSTVGQTQLAISGASLPPGGSCSFSVDLSTSTNTPAGTYTNVTEPVTATITGQTVAGQNASADLTILDTPKLSMVFTDNPVSPGDTVSVSYQITSAEDGNLNATNINFNHDFDATLSGLVAIGLPLNDVCGAGSQISGSNTVTLTGGSISNGVSCDFTLTLQVPAAAVSGSYPSSTSAITAVVNGQNINADPATDVLQITELTFTQQFVDDPALPGGSVTLQYSIENLSTTNSATNLFFTHNLNAVFTGLNNSGGGLTDPCGAGSSLTGTNFIVVVDGSLAPGASCTFSIQLDIPLATANNQYNSVTSQLNATVNGSSLVVDAATDVLTINNNLISFSKAFLNNSVTPGNITSLEFTLTNNDSNNPITGLSFTDDLDSVLSGLVAAGLPLNDICGAGSQLSGTSLLTFTAGSLPPGGSCVFSADVQVPVTSMAGNYLNITSEVGGLLNGLPVTGDPAMANLLVGFIDFNKSFAGPVSSGSSTVLTFTLTNNDVTPLNNLSFSDDLNAALTGLTALAPLPTNPCGNGSQITGSSLLSFSGGQLAAGGSCSFGITVQIPAGLTDAIYTNITTELFQSGLPVAAAATATLQVLGVPVLELIPAAVDFAGVEVGTGTAVQTVTFNNTGLGNLTISSISQANAPFSLETSGSCLNAPFVLAPGNNCTVDFGFTPVVAGIASQDIDVVSDSDAGSTLSLPLTGMGLQSNLTLSPNPLDFGFVELNTTSAPLLVTLSNNGVIDLQVTAITAANLPFALSGGTCSALPIVLLPNASCTLGYNFSPATVGNFNQPIQITSNAPNSPLQLDLLGSGVTDPVFVPSINKIGMGILLLLLLLLAFRTLTKNQTLRRH